jgi:hypothetical protein
MAAVFTFIIMSFSTNKYAVGFHQFDNSSFYKFETTVDQGGWRGDSYVEMSSSQSLPTDCQKQLFGRTH